MTGDYQIVYVDKPEWAVIGGGINDYNTQQAGDDRAQTLCFVLQGPDREVLGGVIGVTFWDWLHLDLMWIQEEHRGRGYGRRLLEMAEAEARQRGATNAFLDTFSFQAPGFYERFGYEVFGELPQFPSGHTRFFLRKEL
jgi:GNAT superfamily N-acetyltransferase